MDHPMDPVHGPPQIAPDNIKIYRRSGYEQKHRLVFTAYVLEGLSRNGELLWGRTP